jgi:micrococcal nuclease
LAALALLGAACSGSAERGAPAGQDESGTVGEVAVESITDGDTLRVTGSERVRLIGIDTPEVSGGVECFGREATAHLTDLIPPGTPLRLEYDAERTDRYGRTLAYVYRADDGLFVNVAMAADGYAAQLTIPPNVARVDEIGDAVAEARAAGRGLWSACTDAEAVGSASGCDPAYPDVCIRPAPPDLDCGDVGARRFRVLAPDPHGFDGDHNGIGCESGA